jgi:beta-galactosidase
LNGLWRFLPVVELEAQGVPATVPASTSAGAKSAAKPVGKPQAPAMTYRPTTIPSQPASEDWGFARVPGSWSKSGWPPVPQTEIAPGAGGLWSLDYQVLTAAWYERSIQTPPAWAGRAVVLELHRVSTDAVVYVDGVECGRVSWPRGEVDLTSALKGKDRATLRILVRADVVDWQKIGEAADSKAIVTTTASLQSRGLIGDVVLSSRPPGAHVADVFVQPSVRQKKLSVDCELVGAQQAGTVRVTAKAANQAGQIEKTFSAEASISATGRQTIKLSWPWDNARLWDLGNPQLYTLHVSVTGEAIADQTAQEFGFREFWIDGRNFYLNGRPIHLRPTMQSVPLGMIELVDAQIDAWMAVGFNFVEMWPGNDMARGCYHWRELLAARADRKGLLLSANALYMNTYILNGGQYIWDRPGQKQRYEQDMLTELRLYRNHPSIVMWGSSGNFFNHGEDQNPALIGQRDHEHHNGAFLNRAAAGKEAVEIIRRHDPSRPIFTHEGSYVGDVYTVNTYLNLIPLQEREEWLSRWAREGQMPYMAVEFGTPLDATFRRGRMGYHEAARTEPLMTEHCAAYLGTRAYELEKPAYRRGLATMGKDGFYSYRQPDFTGEPAMQELLSLFITNTWRSWRTWGISGGMVPWDKGYSCEPLAEGKTPTTMPAFEPGRRGTWTPSAPVSDTRPFAPPGWRVTPAGQALISANGSKLAWIAGGTTADDFTDKTHTYAPNAELAKQLVLINDDPTEQPYTVKWQVIVGTDMVASGTAAGTIASAQVLRLPLRHKLAAVTEKTDCEILLDASIGGAKLRDQFAFRLLPHGQGKGTVLVFDPAGETSAMLKSLGFDPQPWDARTGELVVVGRKAMTAGRDLPQPLLQFVQGGGRVLMMAQEPDFYRRWLNLRVNSFISRRVFAVRADHPVIAGLDDADLRDWAGTSTLLPPYPFDVKDPRKDDPPPRGGWGWRWGARHGVTSAAIETPHISSARPILQCEFDLAYSPLLELSVGKGCAIFCTLDLEDHSAQDPAASRLAVQLLAYARQAPAGAKASNTVYIGSAGGAQMLRTLGLTFTQADAMSPEAELTILGEDAAVDDAALRQYVQTGKRLAVLPRKALAAPLGVELKLVKDFAGSLKPPPWPEAQGLSASDLRYRAACDSWLVAGGCEVGADGLLGRLTIGKGVAVFLQTDPARFDADNKLYFRFTRWRQTRALCAVLADLGASFDSDARLLQPVDPDTGALRLDGRWLVKVTTSVQASASPAEGHKDPGISQAAKALLAPGADETGFDPCDAPGPLKAFESADGEAVFRRSFDLPAGFVGKDLELTLGAVDDFDQTFINGRQVGSIGESWGNWWSKPRVYRVPAAVLKAGRNVVAVRVWDRFGGGGLSGPADAMRLRLAPSRPAAPLYHPDWKWEFNLGDDPCRYMRW